MNMQRKGMSLGITMVSFAALTTGLALAQDEGGPLHKIMEQVNAKTTAIKKSVRTAVAYKKAQSSNEIVPNVQELIRLAKEARGLGKEAAGKAKGEPDPEKKWTELMDAFLQQSEKFAATVSAPSTTQAQAKSAFGVVSQSCTDCHNVFRVEEDDSF